MKLYLVAGEASGDARGAELMRALRALRSDLEFIGAGGPEMRALAGGDFLDWADEAVLGIWDVLKKYGYFKAQFDRMLADLERTRPDALIVIDYPGFNQRLAKAAQRRLPAMKIINYISPQVWAWHRGRIPKMARYLDLMLCIFPFEKPLYEQSGLKTVVVGHPLIDTLAGKKLSASRESKLVGLFPGSREKEVRKIFPTMVEAARQMHRADDSLQFCAVAASPALAVLMEPFQRNSANPAGFEFSIATERAHEMMQRAGAGMVTSGTATLEAAYFGMPLVILYKVAWLTYVIGKRLVKVEFLGMPNILAGREIAREFIQEAAQPEPIAAEMLRLLSDPIRREQQQRDLAEAVGQLGESGAAVRAAAAISEELGWSPKRQGTSSTR